MFLLIYRNNLDTAVIIFCLRLGLHILQFLSFHVLAVLIKKTIRETTPVSLQFHGGEGLRWGFLFVWGLVLWGFTCLF